MASLIRTKSWNTFLPAPIFMWPTSEFPMVPSGRPTSFPEQASLQLGKSLIKESRKGVWARATAFPWVSSRIPHPSRIIRIWTGVSVFMVVLLLRSCFKSGKVYPGGIGPQSFEIIIGFDPGFKHMNNDIPVIQQGPFPFFDAFRSDNIDFLRFQGGQHMFGNGGDLALGARLNNNKSIRIGSKRSHIKSDNGFCFSFKGGNKVFFKLISQKLGFCH